MAPLTGHDLKQHLSSCEFSPPVPTATAAAVTASAVPSCRVVVRGGMGAIGGRGGGGGGHGGEDIVVASSLLLLRLLLPLPRQKWERSLVLPT